MGIKEIKAMVQIGLEGLRRVCRFIFRFIFIWRKIDISIHGFAQSHANTFKCSSILLSRRNAEQRHETYMAILLCRLCAMSIPSTAVGMYVPYV